MKIGSIQQVKDDTLHFEKESVFVIFTSYFMNNYQPTWVAAMSVGNFLLCEHYIRGAKQGGVGGVSTPPEFWMGGLNTCQPP